jgi:very-short-patch-repair endonuclease
MVYLGKSVEKSMHIQAKAELFKYAQEMRKNPTESEKRLWQSIKRFRKEGFIFRRQHPIDIFIADFYCHRIKLIIEVDGEVHSDYEAQEYDAGRTGELQKHGITVIRFTNEQVLDNHDFVINSIKKYITDLASPALQGAGDGRG